MTDLKQQVFLQNFSFRISFKYDDVLGKNWLVKIEDVDWFKGSQYNAANLVSNLFFANILYSYDLNYWPKPFSLGQVNDPCTMNYLLRVKVSHSE